MDTRTLGTLTVSTQGLGCMGMSEFYGTGDQAEAERTIHRALDLGVTFLDTADMYGPYTNERLVGAAIAGRRDEVTLATKFGNERGEDGSFRGINGTPEYVRLIEQGSLRTFGGHTTVIAAFFSAFVSMLMFTVWWYFGKVYCTAFFYVKGPRGRISMKNDVTAYGEEGFPEGIK